MGGQWPPPRPVRSWRLARLALGAATLPLLPGDPEADRISLREHGARGNGVEGETHEFWAAIDSASCGRRHGRGSGGRQPNPDRVTGASRIARAA